MKKSLKVFAWLCLAALCLQGCSNAPTTTDLPESEGSSVSVSVSSGKTSSTDPSTPTPSPSTPAPESSSPSENEDDLPPTTEVTLTEAEILDKMKGGWIGQMVGVAWAAPTEFRWAGQLMPRSNMPGWKPATINDAFGQDDLYVEVPFLDTMQRHGYDCNPKLIAQAFRKTTFFMDHANMQARDNLNNGINYPDSGNYLYNYHSDDIDWQIECDFLGMMYPGMVNKAAEHAFELGHIMNYGDGVYGGVFVSAMHAAAFTATSVEDIVKAGIKVIPEGTQFRMLIDDVMASYKAGDSFEKNWAMLEEKWAPNDLCARLQGPSNIDAKLNSGYIMLGLLYGKGDFAETIILSTRCGQDSDCNPSSAASILGNFYGASGLPEAYTKGLDADGTKFATTNYTFNDIVELNYSIMKEAILDNGAKESEGSFVIPKDNKYTPVKFEQWPDGVYVFLNASIAGNVVTFRELTPYHKGENVVSFKIEMGDGQVFYDVIPVNYAYSKAGNYTVKVTVTGDKGSEAVAEKTFKVTGTPVNPTGRTVICYVSMPGGGGSKDIGVIYDGVAPDAKTGKDNLQYDTYKVLDPVKNPDLTAYIGYVYDEDTTVSKVVFTEGGHFGNGGWFKNGTLKIQLLIDGKWTDAGYTSDKDYPVSDKRSDFGDPFETFTFTLDKATQCQGIRLYGLAGGDASFISVSELEIK
ncbi:MAG: ADP-ribosylglycohydrolase family protein [Clostridia bacterium]|nr:ADP-ribosylglycohydrolase family protein [Clostridia bacterium]